MEQQVLKCKTLQVQLEITGGAGKGMPMTVKGRLSVQPTPRGLRNGDSFGGLTPFFSGMHCFNDLSQIVAEIRLQRPFRRSYYTSGIFIFLSLMVTLTLSINHTSPCFLTTY